MTEPAQFPDRDDVLFYTLRRRRLQAWSVLFFERLWPAIWPPLGVLGAFLCFAFLDLSTLLTPWLHVALLAAFAAGFCVTLVLAVRRVVMPAPGETDRRLERDSGLSHRPLAALADRPALGAGGDLWHAHMRRARAQIARLRVRLPSPGLAARDPRALRCGLLVALAASLGVAWEAAPTRLLRALSPGFAAPAAAAGTQVQAWITPPTYTGLAPVFLKPEVPAVTVPAGAHLTVSLTGGSGPAPGLSLDGVASAFQSLDANSFQADMDLATGGRLSIGRGGRALGEWDLTVVADDAPMVSFPEPPGATRNNRQPQTRLPWQVAHPYGVTGLQAELRLKERPELPPIVITIPLPGGAPKTAKGARLQDLTPHPWAGLPVIARLVARDAPGKVGKSADAEFVLPERLFQNPVARVLMALRRSLTLRPEEREPVVGQLNRLSAFDEVWKDDLPGFLNLRTIAGVLTEDRSDQAVADAQELMWQLALHLEEGATDRTAKALAQANQQLREALEAEKRGDPVDKAEIERLTREVQEALQRHLQALAEEAKRNPGEQAFDPDAQRLDTRDLQRLAEEMREAAREGKMDEAREKQAELEKLLSELENARPEQGKMTERQKQRAEKRERGQQQMTALQDMVKREGALLDQAQKRAGTAQQDPRRIQPFPRLNQQTPEQQEQAQQQQAKDRTQEQAVQGALRRALGELMQQYGDLTGEVPPNLGDADAGMREAMQALTDGRDNPAAGAEQRAIEALQKGGQQMGQQLAQQFGRGGEGDDADDGDDEGMGQMGEGQQDGDQPGNGPGGQQRGPGGRGTRPWPRGQGMDRRADERRDPLGRHLHEGSSGLDESGDVQVPEEMEQARTRAIQDELRKRGAERTRPQPELDYIERLLKQF
jgi:uncharacterized protein (TIGR02302 family)